MSRGGLPVPPRMAGQNVGMVCLLADWQQEPSNGTFFAALPGHAGKKVSHLTH